MSLNARADFSPRARAHDLARLRAEAFDLLIIGGGITGAGIARDAALRGYKVALVEKNDFASGTSSRSSKLVHGGLRYLETYQFHLVYEASRERRVLKRLAPHLVRPLLFIYPLYRNDHYGPLLTRLGLALYDSLALFRNVHPHRMLSRDEVAAQVMALDVSDIVGGAAYYDAQVDDARLTLENARAAHRHGAAVVNHFEIDGLLKNKAGQVNGARAHDVITGERFEVRARIVVNATGPWSDRILGFDSPNVDRRIKPSKGIHIVVPRAKFKTDSAVGFRVPSDNRLMFVIPWGEQTIIGTTDTFYEGDPDQVYADAGDVAYVLSAVNHAFPRAHLTLGDILSTFAGLRPLVFKKGAPGAMPGALSREHRIWSSPSGLMTIAGGKLTTYRSMSAELVRKAALRLRREFKTLGSPVRTDLIPLVEPEPGNERARQVARRRLPSETAEHLQRFYGPRAGRVLDYVTQNPKWGVPLVPGLPYLWAEVPHAVENEMALSLRDLLERRLHVLYEDPEGGMGIVFGVAQELARRLDWSDQEMERELADYSGEVERVRHAIRDPVPV